MEAVVLILGFCGILSFISFRSSFFGLKLIAGMSWFGFVAYWVGNPLPTEFPEGSAAHIAIMVVAIGFGLMIVISGLGRGFKSQKSININGSLNTVEHEGFHLPDWMKNISSNDVEQTRKRETRSKKLEEYEDRMDKALRLGKYSGRRR